MFFKIYAILLELQETWGFCHTVVETVSKSKSILINKQWNNVDSKRNGYGSSLDSGVWHYFYFSTLLRRNVILISGTHNAIFNI